VYSYPVATPYFSDQKRHMGHHRLLGRREDPDWIDYEREEFHSASGIVRFLVGQLIGAKVVMRALDLVRPASGESRASDANRRVKPATSDVLGIACFQLALLGAFTATGRWWEYFLLWVLPLTTVASFLVTFRALLEHVHADGDVEPRSRLYDFSPGPVQRWFLSPSLFHLHALHHTYPGVPYYRLPQLQQTIRDHGYEIPGVVKPDYVRSLFDHLRRLDRAPEARAA
jgi:fatty acid desaturase